MSWRLWLERGCSGSPQLPPIPPQLQLLFQFFLFWFWFFFPTPLCSLSVNISLWAPELLLAGAGAEARSCWAAGGIHPLGSLSWQAPELPSVVLWLGLFFFPSHLCCAYPIWEGFASKQPGRLSPGAAWGRDLSVLRASAP